MAASDHLGQQFSMPAAKFADKFRPTEYDESWEGVKESPDLSMPSPNGRVYDHDALVSDIKTRGIQEPVEVSRGGWVENGHRRTIAGIDAGVNIPYKYVARAHDPEYY